MNKPVAWMSNEYSVCSKKAYENLSQNARSWYPIPLYTQEYVSQLQAENEALKGEVAHLKHINKNWSISEGWALQEIERLKSHPAELTDEEILEVWRENERVYPMDRSRLLDRTRACIKKASEK